MAQLEVQIKFEWKNLFVPANPESEAAESVPSGHL